MPRFSANTTKKAVVSE